MTRRREAESFAEVFANAVAGRTQREVALELGISQTKVSRWMSGAAVPDETTIPRLAKWMGLEEATLVVFLYTHRGNDRRRSLAERLRRQDDVIEEIMERLTRLEEGTLRSLEDRLDHLEESTPPRRRRSSS